ncbi:MAG: hypothetical protein DRO15_01230 [Thermoprotei archaeon]|nr:MAG: hypothetical protein DRO15_01230 [Thermoprotei archaeon]
MPSWRLHRRIYEKLSQEVEGFAVWTNGLLDKIDKIIDAGGEHDLGRKPDPLSFQKLLHELWLEFGDIYDVKNSRFLRLKSRSERLDWEKEAIHMGIIWGDDYMIYIPDDAIALATLHHILDLCMDFLYKNPIKEDESHLMVEYAERELRHYARKLRELKAFAGRTFEEVFRWLIEVLKDKSKQLYRLMIKELELKGLKPGYSPERLRSLLIEYINKMGYYGVIYVNGTPLPVTAATYRIFSNLRVGQEVELGFSRYRGPYPLIYEKIKVSSLEELFKNYQSSINKDI